MHDPTNPYDAPRAALLEIASDTDFLADPNSLPAGNAVEWFAKGWEYFTAAPGTWIAIILLYYVAMVILSCIPFGTNLLAPVFTAGCAIAADKLRRREDVGVDALFDGFRSEHVGQTILVGLLTMVATFAVVLVAMPLMMMLGALTGGMQDGSGGDAAGIVFMALFFALIRAVSLPLAMATAFAPLLVVFEGLSAFDALKMSLRGCWYNLGGGLLWAVIALLVMIVAILPLGLGLLVAAPLLITTNYAAYRDIFYRN